MISSSSQIAPTRPGKSTEPAGPNPISPNSPPSGLRQTQVSFKQESKTPSTSSKSKLDSNTDPDPSNSNRDSDDIEPDMSLVMQAARAALGWMTPYEQMEFLRRKRDLKRWELFRDSLLRRWSNLNVICGLIMGAVSTIVFADFPMSRASFALGIISLLSSLIAIGFGVGMIYVLGDVRGSSIVMVDDRYPRLHLFALSIPEVWAFMSFGTFFAGVSVIVWESKDKGWVVKAGVTTAAVALVGHLVAFGFLFREQDTTQYLIPDEPVFPTDDSKSLNRESKTSEDQEETVGKTLSSSPSYIQAESLSQMQQQRIGEESEALGMEWTKKMKGQATSQDGVSYASTSTVNSLNGRSGMGPSRAFRSSQTLVAIPSGTLAQSQARTPPPLPSSRLRAAPVRASTVPVGSTAHSSLRSPRATVVDDYNGGRDDSELQRSLDAFMPRPAGEVPVRTSNDRPE